MTVSLKSLGLAAVLAMGLAIPAQSQVTATPDLSGVNAACAVGTATVEGCQAAIAAYIAALEASGLSQAEIDAVLTDLAVSLGEASQSGGVAAVIGEALDQISGAISDPVQSAFVTELATAVETDSELPVAAITPASPS